MELKGSLEENSETNVTLSTLRLLVPPLRLLSAAMWQLAKQKDVMNYEKLQEFVFMVTEAVPGLISNIQRAQLILGLRARLILELCKDSCHSSVDPKVIQSHLDRFLISSRISHLDPEVKTTEDTFIALVQSLLKDPVEKAYFFQEVFPVEYGPQYDAALLVLLWELLLKLEKLLPVPDLKQTAAWLCSAPAVGEECAQPMCEELAEVFEHYKSLGLLKVQTGPSSAIGSCIMSALSIPPSQRPNLSVGLQSIHNYANIVNTVTVGAEQYSIVTVYADVGVSGIEGEISGSAAVQVQTDFYEEEIMTVGDTTDMKSINLKNEEISETGDIETTVHRTKSFTSSKQTKDIDVLAKTCLNYESFLNDESRSGNANNNQQTSERHKLCDQISKKVDGKQDKVIFKPCGTENSLDQQGGVHKVLNDCSSESPISEGERCGSSTNEHRSVDLRVETPSRQKNCQMKTSVIEVIGEQKISDIYCTPSVISVKALEAGESEEMISIIFTCSQCPFYNSEQDSPPHFHMQNVHPDIYRGLSGTTFTPSPLSTDEIFTSIKLFPKANPELSKREKSRQSAAISFPSSQSRKRDFSCKTCGKTFTRTSDVRRHQLTHTGERPFHCSQCDRTFQHSWDLAKHESKRHRMAISFSCQICKSSFANLRALTVHHKKSHFQESQLPHFCSICSQSFPTSSQLLDHRKCHVTSKQYVCQQCGESFDTLLARSQHRHMHQVKRQFKCPHCEKMYTRRSDVKRHMSIHTGERPYQCNQCHKRFSLRFMLLKHLRVHTGERPFQCSHCPKRFTLMSVLARHERMHTGEKPFLCSQCGKGFLSQGELSKHNRSHIDDRPYSCLQCDKRFKSKKSMQEHLISHSGARPYPCSYCGKGFTKSYALTRHNLIHTGERPFPCAHCEKSFLTLSEAQLHQRIHTGERPYPCNLCALKFKSSSELSRHKRSHSGLKPMKPVCEQCMKTFTSTVKLKKHMAMHKNEKTAHSLDSRLQGNL